MVLHTLAFRQVVRLAQTAVVAPATVLIPWPNFDVSLRWRQPPTVCARD
jgi:hypothetical protein